MPDARNAALGGQALDAAAAGERPLSGRLTKETLATPLLVTGVAAVAAFGADLAFGTSAGPALGAGAGVAVAGAGESLHGEAWAGLELALIDTGNGRAAQALQLCGEAVELFASYADERGRSWPGSAIRPGTPVSSGAWRRSRWSWTGGWTWRTAGRRGGSA